MGKRFNDLEDRLINALKGGSTIDQIQKQTVDKELAAYATWAFDPADESHNLPETSSRELKGQYAISLNPIGRAGVDDPVMTTISKRAGDADVLTTALKDALGWRSDHGTVIPEPIPFTPARVSVREKSASKQSRTSRITKRKYKTRYASTDQGYVYPFGKKTATQTFENRANAIKEAINTAIYGIAFQNEAYPSELFSLTPRTGS